MLFALKQQSFGRLFWHLEVALGTSHAMLALFKEIVGTVAVTEIVTISVHIVARVPLSLLSSIAYELAARVGISRAAAVFSTQTLLSSDRSGARCLAHVGGEWVRQRSTRSALTDKWYVQPLITNPQTDIDENGFWKKNWTHLGERYAPLIVRTSFRR
jgi:hypothetical protein